MDKRHCLVDSNDLPFVLWSMEYTCGGDEGTTYHRFCRMMAGVAV